jgi:hypothetical protein
MSVFNTVMKAGQACTNIEHHCMTENIHDVELDLHRKYIYLLEI